MENPQRCMPMHRVQTQARACAQVILSTLSLALLAGKPADRCLKDAFYANRQFGSRDRRLISETLFGVLRWWGWLRKIAPVAFLEAMAQGKDSCADIPLPKWYRVFVGAWLLESPAEIPQAVHVWADFLQPENLELNFVPATASWQEKWNSLHPLFYPEKNPQGKLLDLLPDWILHKIAPEETIELEKLTTFLQKRPPLWLRGQISDIAWLQRTLKEEGAKVWPHPKMNHALRCEAPALNLRAMKSFRQGDFEIQDLASQCVALVCAPLPGQQWWDACAGGGGKTLHLAWLMEGKGSVLATDIRTHKLEELKLRARRAEFPNIRCKEWKGKAMPKWNQRFDGVLVDTPCSCSGTWRRNPDARWSTKPAELPEFTRLQKQILTNAATAVKPGGILVYSTCSMLREENQGVVEAFLAENPNFALCPFTCPLDGIPCNGMRQIWPWQGDCDAMFTAKLRRKE